MLLAELKPSSARGTRVLEAGDEGASRWLVPKVGLVVGLKSLGPHGLGVRSLVQLWGAGGFLPCCFRRLALESPRDPAGPQWKPT